MVSFLATQKAGFAILAVGVISCAQPTDLPSSTYRLGEPRTGTEAGSGGNKQAGDASGRDERDCENEEKGLSIVGGEFMRSGSPGFASSVMLAHAARAANGNWSVFCSGTLVGPQTVLTAQHCVVGVPSKDIVVLTGINTLSVRDAIPVVDQAHHPQSPTKDLLTKVDLALLKLAQAPSAPAKPALVFTGNNDELKSTVLRGVGSGRVSNMHNASGVMKFVDILPSAVANFASSGIDVAPIHGKSLIFKTPPDSSVCNGDSGGGFFLRDNAREIVVAVAKAKVIRPNGECRSDVDGAIATLVSAEIEWMRESDGAVKSYMDVPPSTPSPAPSPTPVAIVTGNAAPNQTTAQAPTPVGMMSGTGAPSSPTTNSSDQGPSPSATPAIRKICK